ncbi:MAG: hypothetical protein WAW88_08125, partial [Nocardioides sp.]
MSSDYRMAPALAAKLLGLSAIALALIMFVLTILLAFMPGPVLALLPVAAIGMAGISLVAYLVRTRVVVRLTDVGYRVAMIRGAGTPSGRWADVEEVAAATLAGEKCVVLRLRSGESTTIPTSALAADPEEFARDVREHVR